jgi:hypothetical protein
MLWPLEDDLARHKRGDDALSTIHIFSYLMLLSREALLLLIRLFLSSKNIFLLE